MCVSVARQERRSFRCGAYACIAVTTCCLPPLQPAKRSPSDVALSQLSVRDDDDDGLVAWSCIKGAMIAMSLSATCHRRWRRFRSITIKVDFVDVMLRGDNST